MGKLIRSALISLLILALAIPAMAAQITIVYDEPGAVDPFPVITGCKEFRVYFCYGTNCEPQSEVARFAASDADCDQADRSLVFPLDIQEERVGDVCFRITAVTTNGDESVGDTFCETATAGG